MKPKDQHHLIFRIIEFGMNKDWFYLKDLYKELSVSIEDKNYIMHNLVRLDSDTSPNHIITTVSSLSKKPSGQGEIESFEHTRQLRILPTAVFSYVDHLEIVE